MCWRFKLLHSKWCCTEDGSYCWLSNSIAQSVMHGTLLCYMCSARRVAFWKELHLNEKRGCTQPYLDIKRALPRLLSQILWAVSSHECGFLQMRHSSPRGWHNQGLVLSWECHPQVLLTCTLCLISTWAFGFSLICLCFDFCASSFVFCSLSTSFLTDLCVTAFSSAFPLIFPVKEFCWRKMSSFFESPCAQQGQRWKPPWCFCKRTVIVDPAV